MTEPIRPMLLCLDLESDSEALCRLALERARRCGQTLLVLHVMQTATEPQQTESRIHALLTRCAAEPAQVILETGTPEELIPQVATRSRADPVVLGRRHRATIDRIYVGSTTSAVISQTRVPVLVIPLHGED